MIDELKRHIKTHLKGRGCTIIVLNVHCVGKI